MRNVVIIDGVRTPFGKIGGGLKNFASSELAGYAIKSLIDKTQITMLAKVNCLFAGSAMHDSKALSPARYAAQLAGLPFDVSCTYIEMQCGSAIDAMNHAAWKIGAGAADVIIAGGMESFSQATVKFSMATEPYKMIPPMPLVPLLAPDPKQNIDMITVSENMAKKWGISREACDEFAYQSQLFAAQALQDGTVGKEISPVIIPATRKSPEVVVSKDEQLFPGTTMEGLAKLRPVLGEGCVTTAGNSSGRNDGAAFVLMMSEEMAMKCGFKPRARWVCGADIGVEPNMMGIGPAYSNLICLEKAGLKIADIDVFECNEAFSSQNLSVIKEMEKLSSEKIDRNKWNPNGGAISFGHPNGASGARIALFAIAQLEKTGNKYGLISSCVGGGMGVTTLIERYENS